MGKKNSSKIITVGIPAFHAEDHICDVLSSISIQTVVDKVKVIIAKDDVKDNYDFVKTRFPNLDITILPCEKNGGPGIARQRALEACDTDWITFIDADDVFISPLSLESLITKVQPNVVEVQGTFFQEIKEPNPQGMRLMPRNDVSHPLKPAALYSNIH